ncbi:hypothetical protein [Actinomadura sp. 6N118]|uniref:hypothetical protein n=1 Tax=Actinomadura sp. 6N118 TaxID=3375151 RepID=UPI0037A4C748
MPERFAVLSARPVSRDGQHLLILPNGTTELVHPDATDEDLITRHNLDSVVHAPKIEVFPAVFLDGPRAGERTWFAANKVGERFQTYLPPRPGGPIATYQVVKASQDGQPAELRLIEINNEATT